MTSWLAIEYYSPLLVLLIGILTFTGIAGLGLVIQRIMKISLPAPWGQTLGILIGIQTVSLVVQFLSMTGLAYKSVLICIWLLVVLVGNFSFAKWALPLVPEQYQRPNGLALFPLFICFTGLTINLLTAIAPCVRNDELHYHMLIPSRIVVDNALLFYQQPWEGAILPQMIYQISTTPLHALGFPDAANVVSWCLGLTLVWFGWYLISEKNTHPLSLYIWITPIAIGYWPIVYHVTGGAHAMSDISTAVAMVALLKSESLVAKIGIKRFSFLYSITLLSMTSSKLVYAPLALALLISLLIVLRFKKFNRREIFQAGCLFIIPWIIYYLPIVLWTLWQSGSPFGPILSNKMKSSVYQVGEIKSIIETNVKSRYTIKGLIFQIKKFGIRFSPLYWMTIAMFIAVRGISAKIRLVTMCLILFQLMVVSILLPLEGRYLAAVFQGALLTFAIFCPADIEEKIRKYIGNVVGIMVLFLPWLFIQSYYAQQFLPMSLMFQDKKNFYEKYISFYEDFEKLDNVVSKDSVILVQGLHNIFKIPYQARMSSAYSPRPIYLEADDLPEGMPVVLFQLNKLGAPERLDVPRGYEVDKMIYENKHALYKNLVRIGRPVRELILKVYKLRAQPV